MALVSAKVGVYPERKDGDNLRLVYGPVTVATNETPKSPNITTHTMVLSQCTLLLLVLVLHLDCLPLFVTLNLNLVCMSYHTPGHEKQQKEVP